MVDSPDKTQVHKVNRCACCGDNLGHQEADRIERRQVYDHPPLELIITEHQAEVKRCSCGHLNKGEFPSGVDHYVQYGPNIKGLLVYMQDYQLLSYDRTREFVQDLFGHCLSTGTLHNIRHTAFEALTDFEDRLKLLLARAIVAGFDETGIRIMAKRLWLHSCSTDQHAYYEAHAKRGQVGLAANPFQIPDTKKNRRHKKTPPRNLVERFRDYPEDILRFFYDFSLPFDNNFSERDLRMMKVKQKISGCFRSFQGAKCIARIRSFIITARKQNLNVFKGLSNLFTHNDISLQLAII